jgi:hypothetical protein
MNREPATFTGPSAVTRLQKNVLSFPVGPAAMHHAFRRAFVGSHRSIAGVQTDTREGNDTYRGHSHILGLQHHRPQRLSVTC